MPESIHDRSPGLSLLGLAALQRGANDDRLPRGRPKDHRWRQGARGLGQGLTGGPAGDAIYTPTYICVGMAGPGRSRPLHGEKALRASSNPPTRMRISANGVIA